MQSKEVWRDSREEYPRDGGQVMGVLKNELGVFRIVGTREFPVWQKLVGRKTWLTGTGPEFWMPIPTLESGKEVRWWL